MLFILEILPHIQTIFFTENIFLLYNDSNGVIEFTSLDAKERGIKI